MSKTVDLDVREMLRQKQEPFQKIMQSIEGLDSKGDTFILHATFRPDPLLGVFAKKGFANSVEQLADDHWVVTFVHE